MIIVSSALKISEIIGLLDQQVIEEVRFNYIKTEGIQMYFEVDHDDLEAVIKIVKKAIRETVFGSGLFFRVAYEGRKY